MLRPSRLLLKTVSPYLGRLCLTGVLSILSSGIWLGIPWLAGRLIDRMLVSHDSGKAWLVFALLAALAAVAILAAVTSYVTGKTSILLLADLRLLVYDHLQRLPVEFHDTHKQGDTLALMTYEVASLGSLLTDTLATIPSRVVILAGAVILMLRIDTAMALLVPFVVPVYYVILRLVGRRMRRLAQSRQQAEAEVVAIAEENLAMLPAIKAFAREEDEAARYARGIDAAARLSFKEQQIFAVLEPLLGLVSSASAVVLLVWVGNGVQTGATAPADLFSFLLYAALLTQPIAAFAQMFGHIQMARGTLARLNSVLEREVEPGLSAEKTMPSVRGSISFEQVCFAYPGRSRTFAGFSLQINAGETVALLGNNGAGKSTIISLLLRFYDPQSGTICLDDIDIKTIQVQDLRRMIGLVPQRPMLFDGTIRANIAFGLSGCSDDDIERAAQLSQAHEFITRLPNGYETEIGDHGIRLSGGQRQRIALARALIKDPPILILDEATSMYDIDGENAFIEACTSALKGRTVILITHRPGSLALADRIVTIEDLSAAANGDNFCDHA